MTALYKLFGFLRVRKGCYRFV